MTPRNSSRRTGMRFRQRCTTSCSAATTGNPFFVIIQCGKVLAIVVAVSKQLFQVHILEQLLKTESLCQSTKSMGRG